MHDYGKALLCFLQNYFVKLSVSVISKPSNILPNLYATEWEIFQLHGTINVRKSLIRRKHRKFYELPISNITLIL